MTGLNPAIYIMAGQITNQSIAQKTLLRPVTIVIKTNPTNIVFICMLPSFPTVQLLLDYSLLKL